MNHLQRHSLQLLGRKETLTRSARGIIAVRRRVAIRASELAGVSRRN